MLKDLSERQRALADYMSDLSEEAYCAGWLCDLEYELWTAVLGESGELGRLEFSPTEVGELKRLSEACGGWIVFDNELEETWLPLAEWRIRYGAWRESESRRVRTSR